MSRTFRGLGVSSGVGVGRALLLDTMAPPVRGQPIEQARIAEELRAFREARARAREELQDLRRRVLETLGETFAALFDAHVLILDDPGLVVETESRIADHAMSASWALKEAVDAYFRRFAAVEDVDLRERGGDLADVHRRLQRILAGETARATGLEGPVVAVAHSVGPADAVALARRGVVALATDLGGRTSHTAILAQALGVPAVVGLRDISRHVHTGDTLVVDGDVGEVVLGPDPLALADARDRRRRVMVREEAASLPQAAPALTRDGVEITLRVNVEFPEEVEQAVRFGAQGIGLYRSEFLFLGTRQDLPSEEEHERTYRDLAARMAPHPVVVRTMDLGAEKSLPAELGSAGRNPVLGLRGVRLSLRRPDVLRPQLRGVLRASADADVRLLIPMVSSADELRAVRGLLARESDLLRAAGVPCRPDLPVGAMIEVPAAALCADLLAAEADFLSIGTNDLIQFTLAVDRNDDTLGDLSQPLHPAVLRLLRAVLDAGAARRIPVAVCGEMAAQASLVPVLVGLGLRELSVPPRAIAAVRAALADVDTLEARASAEALLAAPTAGAPRSP